MGNVIRKCFYQLLQYIINIMSHVSPIASYHGVPGDSQPLLCYALSDGLVSMARQFHTRLFGEHQTFFFSDSLLLLLSLKSHQRTNQTNSGPLDIFIFMQLFTV